MAQVGSVVCDIVRGLRRPLEDRVRTWNVPGLDGYGAHNLGRHDSSFQFRLVRYGSAATVQSWIDALQALQGTAVTVINDWGDSFTNMLIERIGDPLKQAALGYGGARGELDIRGVVLA